MSKQRFVNRKLAKQKGFAERRAKERQRGGPAGGNGRAIMKSSSGKY